MGRSEPWIIAGDFNVIASSEERRGGRPANGTNMDEFNSSMFLCGLSPVDYDGCPFTWTNGTVWQLLDRALINARWAAAYPVTRVSHFSRDQSDHAPLLIKAGLETSVRTSFRYLNMWHRHPTFWETVSTVWQGSGSGVGMHLFYSKLSSLRTQLRKWNKKEFGNIFARVQSIEDTYKQQEAEFDSRGDVSSKTRLHEARAMQHFGGSRRGMQTPPSSTQWSNSNYVARVKDEALGWIQDVDDIQDSAVRFFSALFQSSGFVPPPTLPLELPRVATEEDEGLRHLPDLEEIRAVVFSIDASSAPGPNGFGAGFLSTVLGDYQRRSTWGSAGFF
ncbi:uncharacterized protein LOC113758060 [Coffea eugenioides]|uniref:uncharacterized protein LOC113758060 n=1 Tax=Coffea eugenioides TaxID=49369 RepID=UPI000F60B7B5|nr:uncharacterized protein LOC113758060 [Coffea eugenioides]